MSRIRAIKPEFFLDEDLGQISPIERLVFVGLWTLADREGRLEDRPTRIKAQVLPYDNDIDLAGILDDLTVAGFIVRYSVQVGGQERRYVQIRSFAKHQKPHPKEPASSIPPPDAPGVTIRQPRRRPASSTPAVERNGEPGKETAKPGETLSGRVDLDLDLDPDLVISDPVISDLGMGAVARAHVAPDVPVSDGRKGFDWLTWYGRRWCEQYRTVAYGRGTGDSKATASLGDVLRELPDVDVADAWARRDQMADEFFRSHDRGAREAKHPFAFFVARFNALRARAGPPPLVTAKTEATVAAVERFARGEG